MSLCYVRDNEPNEILKLISLFPPNPPKYTLISIEDNKKTNNNDKQTSNNDKQTNSIFINRKEIEYENCKMILKNNAQEIKFSMISVKTYKIKKYFSEQKIILIHIINNNKRKNSNTIIYSHDSYTDLGGLYGRLIDLSLMLKCDIISYDYLGYGQSEGIPNEKELFSDIYQIMVFIVSILNIKIDSIILFGNSIGCTCSLYIAQMKMFSQVAGVILMNCMTSGLDIFNYTHELFDESLDVFNNIPLAQKVNCPAFIIHGMKNDIIPINHAYILQKALKKSFYWYPNKGNNNNIFSKFRYELYTNLIFFVKYINKVDDNIINKCPRINLFSNTIGYKEEKIKNEDSKKEINNKNSSIGQVTGNSPPLKFSIVNPSQNMVDKDEKEMYENVLINTD